MSTSPNLPAGVPTESRAAGLSAGPAPAHPRADGVGAPGGNLSAQSPSSAKPSAWQSPDVGLFRRPRTARRHHHCATCDLYAINPGDRYWQYAASPAFEWNSSGRWQRMNECQSCAARYDRPIPAKAAA